MHRQGALGRRGREAVAGGLDPVPGGGPEVVDEAGRDLVDQGDAAGDALEVEADTDGVGAMASSTIVTRGEQTRWPKPADQEAAALVVRLGPEAQPAEPLDHDRGRVGLQHHRVGAGGELAGLAAVHGLAGGPLTEGVDVQVGQGRLGPLGPAGARPGVDQDREAGPGGRPRGPDPAGVGHGDLQLAGLAGPGRGHPRGAGEHPATSPARVAGSAPAVASSWRPASG